MTSEDQRPSLFDAVLRISRALESSSISHVFIGGIAMAAWGKPRTTIDIDLLVLGPESKPAAVIDALGAQGFEIETDIHREVMMAGFRLRRAYERSYASSVAVDVLLSSNPVVADIIQRSCVRKIGDIPISVPSAEDFIVLKLQAGRMQDLADAQTVYRALADTLDVAYLETRVELFDVSKELEQIKTSG